MWIDQVLGNVETSHPSNELKGRLLDFVDVDWFQCTRRLNAVTATGKKIRVLLSAGQRLRDGDVLADDGAEAIVIRVRPLPMIVVESTDLALIALLALELGNLHWPTQIASSQIIFPEDGPAMAAVEKFGLPWRREERKFEPALTSVQAMVTVSPALQVIRAAQKTS